jgi:hypothetical protein
MAAERNPRIITANGTYTFAQDLRITNIMVTYGGAARVNPITATFSLDGVAQAPINVDSINGRPGGWAGWGTLPDESEPNVDQISFAGVLTGDTLRVSVRLWPFWTRE